MNIKEKGVFMNIACSLSKIGEILLKQNKITDEQLNEALILQASNGKKLGEILIERGYITEITLLEALSEQLITHVSFSDMGTSDCVRTQFPYALNFQI